VRRTVRGLALVAPLVFAVPLRGQQVAPSVVEIYRDHIGPGGLGAVDRLERDGARICRDLHCPHPYMGLESLTGPKEVWFLNFFGSRAEVTDVGQAYASNAALTAALNRIVKAKEPHLVRTTNVFVTLDTTRADPSAWRPGGARFLVVTWRPPAVTPSAAAPATAFRTEDHAPVVFVFAATRQDADRVARAFGPAARVLAIRPQWSMPSADWTAADPTFWSP
jgi:hypothetical protein